MSAICGRVHPDGQAVSAQIMEQLMGELQAYGPDGGALWKEGAAALGHQMLHVSPESLHEKLPYQDSLTGLVITADARLDNREELFISLDISPQVGRQLSDAQLILRAYVHWDDQCPKHLLGDFAFAIWDARQKKLFCARDIFGIRPFFYYKSSTCFVFASDLSALLMVPGVPSQLNEPLLAEFLNQKDIRFAQKELTFYEEIYRLPPAHYLTLTPNHHAIRLYWSPEAVPKIRLKSEADYLDKLRDLLDEAVRCRIRSAFPVGAHLSGGLDSSAIAVAASRALQSEGKTLKGFSWSPPLTTSVDSSGDERLLVEEICERENIDCQYLSLRGQDLLNHRTRNFLTEPTEMLQFEQKVQSEVKARNIRVMLSGWGGDEAITFNGRGYFAELFTKGNWWALFKELKLRGEMHGLGMKGQVVEKVILPLLPDALTARLGTPITDGYLLSGKSAYAQPSLTYRVQASRKALPRLPYLLREQSSVRANQRMLLKNGHLTRRVEDWAISGGKQNIVYTYPLLDRRIVEYALGIPADLFFKHGWKRYLFRAATEGLLPDSIRWNKSKVETATVKQIRASNAEISETWKGVLRARVQANSESIKLAELVDLGKLDQVLTGQSSPQEGYGIALRLVAAFSENNKDTETKRSKTLPMTNDINEA